jgi:polysaccharide biosynthesis protein PelF
LHYSSKAGENKVLEEKKAEAAREKVTGALKAIDALDPSFSTEEESILSSLKSEEELHILAEEATRKSFKIKYVAIKHISSFPYESIVKDLIIFLYDENELIRGEAQRSLDGFGSDAKYDHILTLLDSKDLSILIYAVVSLGKGEKVAAVLPLISLLDHENSDVVYKAIDALRLIGDQRSDDLVMNRLSSSEPKVRYAAAFYCGSRKIGRSCGMLARLTRDENRRIRLVAVWALGQQIEMNCISCLMDMLEIEKEVNIRNEIFRILNKRGMLSLLQQKYLEPICFETENSVKCVSDWYLTYIIKERKLQEADICLFVEGSYPYVAGGVSSWVQDVLKYFHEISFSIVHINTAESELREFRYEVPSNVIYLKEIFLYDVPMSRPIHGKDRESLESHLNRLSAFLVNINNWSEKDFEELYRSLGLPDRIDLDLGELLFSHEAWKFLSRIYQEYLSELPFLEYVWSYRSILLPIYNVIKEKMPPAKLFYSALTGYAGLAAVVAKIDHKKPMMLTEHGIYHRERMMEINRASWIYVREEEGYVARDVISGLKKVWITMYHALSSIAYRFSDSITSLYKDNRDMQIEGGADPEKITIIPNGIDSQLFAHIKDGLGAPQKFTIALIGRVVSIKDIKSYIRSARIVRDQIGGDVTFEVLGPLNEEREYSNECLALVEMLGLKEAFNFPGNVNLKEHLKKVDLVVLTSISEGQPLSIMEAMAAGIPCVATNVGACRELLYGKDEDDSRRGKAGLIVPVHSPYETARAIISIIRDPALYEQMSRVGKERMAVHYEREKIYELYRREFNRFLK